MRRVERWAGLTRTVSNWDGLRRDPELWYEHGDCLVHLYAVGQSRRGPSFCVPFHVLKQSNCGSMFSLCFAQTTTFTTTTTKTASRRSNNTGTQSSVSKKVELFVPAPEDTTRDASFRWHITTRNFFAFIFGKPLVGTNLGQAMVDLQERMRLFRSGRVDNQQDFLSYADVQGYRDFANFPDYSLAMLYYAEHYKLRDIWIDAFAHCVGMNGKFVSSPEFMPQSRLTKALITRASLEMDIGLNRTTLAVRNFLEDDLSPAYLGLTNGARYHLDRFRSFLHSFYVDKFGYWPPPKGTTFSKALYRSLYFDFKNLYDYIVDLESTTDLASQKLASGGICVLQNVSSFDTRHKFPSLPHPMPLLPCGIPDARSRTDSQRFLRELTLGCKRGKEEWHLGARAALLSATNGINNTSLIEAPIIRAYMQFERQSTSSYRDENISIADARKVRWLLIYGTLQYLISALGAPTEVRDTEGSSYFLPSFVAEHAQWQTGISATSSSATRPIDDAIHDPRFGPDGSYHEIIPPLTCRTPIEPDCQNFDYFLHTNIDPGSSRTSVDIPAPLNTSQPSRTSSARSRRRLSLSSLGSRRNSMTRKPQMHCEILVHGYGNGLNEMAINTPSQQLSRTTPFDTGVRKQSSRSTIDAETSSLRPSTPHSTSHPSGKCSDGVTPACSRFPEPQFTPHIESTERDRGLTVNFLYDGSATPSTISNSPDSLSSKESSFSTDSVSSASSRSSTYEEHSEAMVSPAEECGLLGGLVPIIASPYIPERRSSLQFNFHEQASLADSLYTLEPTYLHSGIGVAVSDPPSVSTMEIPYSQTHTSLKTEKEFGFLSTVSVLPDAPLEARPPSIAKKERRRSFWRR
ncbi:hypothetical protein BU23DRAFT_307646 [Bimuria novae-zelandiae CBS 107.79]|uniref:DUF8004 domain-containing protein n=1 Tax=Bimuria novae-zelandiae CBS 107.79 TaxID=1447943 RepID=A0A6A5URA8_9PLEO|nr:hypothetical protein BU23DRAFT_307646 [Bimuria novae-zelandiae CBS 107.79]